MNQLSCYVTKRLIIGGKYKVSQVATELVQIPPIISGKVLLIIASRHQIDYTRHRSI